ncbi:hypothetical protein GGQ84_002704 [Desulfitispora alkaliphila]|uniref:Spo0E family sporulation regulatory protein-aspartic acid phosphatase n=1 Tax=Desulfitispora alkaliphila TaxID=622674 RepID=UPI003D1D382C
MCNDKLLKDIITLRKELAKVSMEKGDLQNKQVQRLSQKLDKLVIKYYKKVID